MLRLLAGLIISVLAITFLRSVLGLIMKTFADMLHGERSTQTAGAPPGAPRGGELKRDPVCGTFVATETSVKKTVQGGVVHFCSAACRDKFV